MPNLNDYGIDLADLQDDPKATLAKVLSLYSATVKDYRDSGEKQSTGVKKVSEAIKTNDETTVALTDSLVEKIRGLIYESVTTEPKVSVLLFERMQDIRDGIANFRTEALKGFDLAEDDDDENDSEATSVDLAEKFGEVEFLHQALGNFVNFATMSGLSVHELPGDLRKVNKKSGKTEVSLPRKPNSPETKENDTAKGRQAFVYQMRYMIDGTEIPSGVSLNRLALFYCSTPTEWITGAELMAQVDKETDGKFAAGGWETVTPKGTLSAVKVSKP